MIQHMNNTLVKHNKVFFTILLIIIVIGFVMFFGAMDPTSFLGELLGGSRNNLGRVFDKEDVTISEVNTIRKKAHLLAAINPNFASSISADNLFYLSAFEKAARINGISVSDKELQEAIAAMPTFAGEDGKFSAEVYKTFIDALGKNYQATATDFEEAFRMFLSIQKFQISAADALSVSDNEIDTAIDALSLTATVRTIRFATADFEKDVTVSDEEVKEYYNSKSKDIYLESTALVVYLNANAIKDIKIDAKQIEEAKKSGLYEGKKDEEIAAVLTKNAAADAASKKVTDFRKDLIKVYDKEEYTKDPAAYIKSAAAANGLEVTSAEGLTFTSPETPILNNSTISAICQLKKLNTFTQVIKNGDASMVAVLIKRNDPSADKLEKVIYPEIKKIRLEEKMRDAALAKAKTFSDAAQDGKITVENLEAEAKKYGAVLGEEKSETILTDLITRMEMLEKISAQDKNMMDGLVANVAGNIAPLLQMPAPYVNLCTPPYSASDAAEINFCVKCVQSTGITVSPFVRNVIKEAILANKTQAAAMSFGKWIDKNILRYMTEEEKQQQQESAGE